VGGGEDGDRQGQGALNHPAMPSLVSRFRGCLLGGAVGDALGAPVEFLSLAEIRERFGLGGIRDMVEAYGRVGAITDDTQMTLFTAEGLLRARARELEKGIMGAAVALVRDSYMRWLHTQGVPPRKGSQAAMKHGWLMRQRELHSQRAPGNTCISALLHPGDNPLEARNTSKGCGGVMRVAPVALYAMPLSLDAASKDAFAYELAMKLAGITHGHPTAKHASGMLAVLILALLEGVALEPAIGRALAVLRTHEEGCETERAVALAMDLAQRGKEPAEAISQLGEGWISEEALAIAIYCALASPDFEAGVISAVNIDGDSDSTGSITGQILGARDGEQAIPGRWIEELELREVIGETAEDFIRIMEPESVWIWDVDEFRMKPV
jgi:ADP-ribosylglycohydrolase